MRKKKVPVRVRREVEERLRHVARAGEVFVDGEVFRGIVLDPEVNTGDDYQVRHENFIAVKQTLLKLKRLVDGDVGVVAWRRFKDQADMVVSVDIHPCSTRPGNHPLTEAMTAAFAGRTAFQEIEIKGFPALSACGPIRDSLDDVVGVVEVYASLAPDAFSVDLLDY